MIFRIRLTGFLLGMGLCLLVSCTSKSDFERNVVVVESSKELMTLNDSTFYDGFSEFINNDGNIYVADKSPRIYRLDEDLEPINIIDNNGRGPGEFTFVTDLSYSRDSLYVLNRSQGKAIVYDKSDRFIREIHFEDFDGARDMEVSQDGFFYLSTPFAEKPITVLNSNGEKVKTFGEQTADPEQFNVFRNQRLLALQENKLIAVSISDPFVWVYDLEGNLLYKLVIEHPLLKDRVIEINESYEKPSPQGGYMLMVLFEGIAIFGNDIYIATRTNTDGSPISKFTIVLNYEIEEDGELVYKKDLKLFRRDKNNRLTGVKLGLLKEGKLLMYDLASDNLILFKDAKI